MKSLETIVNEGTSGYGKNPSKPQARKLIQDIYDVIADNGIYAKDFQKMTDVSFDNWWVDYDDCTIYFQYKNGNTGYALRLEQHKFEE